jgi:hypothetical protein
MAKPHPGRERAVDLVREGFSIVEAAREVGASWASVYNWCVEAGVKSKVNPRKKPQKAAIVPIKAPQKSAPELRQAEVYIVAGKESHYYTNEASALEAVRDSSAAKPPKLRHETVLLIDLEGGTYVLGPQVRAKYTSKAEIRAAVLARLTEEEKEVLGL